MFVFIKNMFLAAFLVSAVFAVAACSSDDAYKKSPIEVRNNTQGEITNGLPAQDSAMDIGNAAISASNGSVEIYNLDGSVTASVAPVQPDYIGIPSASDPRVIVYPVDGDGGMYPAPVPSAMGGYMPMNNGGIMSPSPSTAWVDEPMAVEEGVLSPRVGQNLSSVYFGYGSAKLNGENKRALSNIAETAKFAPVDRVSVEGYASRRAQTQDPIKAKILNLKESMNRAQTVSQGLIENGVPVEKIKTTAWGDTKPQAGGEAQNRRVDIITGFGQ